MSLNYNSALLRTLKEPLLDAIKSVQSELTAVENGGKSTSEINAREMSNIHGSFTMMGYPSMIRVSSDLKTALDCLISSEKSAWDKSRVLAVSKLCMDLMAQLTDHIKSLDRGEKDYAVRMYSTLSSLRSMIDLPPVESKVLFDPDPLAVNEDFKNLEVEKLRELCAKNIDSLASLTSSITSAVDQEDRQIIIRKMLEIFDWVYGLKSSRGYHAFWLLARGRCAIELLNPVADILPFRDAIKVTLVELGKFSEGSKKPKIESMQVVMSNMLDRWPSSWSSHPVLFELENLFGLDDFWRAHDEARNLQASRSENAFVAKQDDLLENIRVIKAAWTKICAEGGDVRPFLRALLPFLPKYEQFPNPGVHPLMESLKAIAYRFVNEKKTNVTSDIEQEVAVAILLIEETIEKKGRWTSDLESQSELVKKRVTAACAEDAEELASLPVVVWGSNRRRQQSQEAIAKVAEQLRADLSFIEENFDEFFRGDVHEAKSHYTSVRVKSFTAKSILDALGQHKAAQIMSVILDLSAILNRSTPPDKLAREQATLTLAITGISAFLVSIEKGDSDAHRSIDQVSEQLGLISEQRDRTIEDVVSAYQPKTTQNIEETSVLPDQQKMTSEQHKAERAISSMLDFKDEVVDPEIADCFFEEAESVLEEISVLRGQLSSSRDSSSLMADFRRQYHTLKGSGRTAQIWGLGEIAKRIEERLNEALADKEHYSDKLDQLAESSLSLFSEGLSALKQEGSFELTTDKYSKVLSDIDKSKADYTEESQPQEVYSEPELTLDETTEIASPSELELVSEDVTATELTTAIEEPSILEIEPVYSNQPPEDSLVDTSEDLSQPKDYTTDVSSDSNTVDEEAHSVEHSEDFNLNNLSLENDTAEIASNTFDLSLENKDQELTLVNNDSAAAGSEDSEPYIVDDSTTQGLDGIDQHQQESQVIDTFTFEINTSNNEVSATSNDYQDDDDALPLQDIIEDLQKHLDNLNELILQDNFDLRSLNWSVHTIASLSHTLSQDKLRAFSKSLESKVDFCLASDEDEFVLSSPSRHIIEKSIFLLIEKLEQLINSPSDEITWDVIDEVVEQEVAELDLQSSLNGHDLDQSSQQNIDNIGDLSQSVDVDNIEDSKEVQNGSDMPAQDTDTTREEEVFTSVTDNSPEENTTATLEDLVDIANEEAKAQNNLNDYLEPIVTVESEIEQNQEQDAKLPPDDSDYASVDNQELLDGEEEALWLEINQRMAIVTSEMLELQKLFIKVSKK